MSEFSLNASLCPSHRLLQDGSGCAYDKESLAIIKLNNTTVLYLKEVTKFLALVCILREESFERKGLFFFGSPAAVLKQPGYLCRASFMKRGSGSDLPRRQQQG